MRPGGNRVWLTPQPTTPGGAVARCMACGRHEPTIPGFRGHECSAPVGGSPVKVDQQVKREGLTGHVVEIDRTMALVYWTGSLQFEWYPADDVADWAASS